MSQKTYKIGEVCKGGVITVLTTSMRVTIIAKEWDHSAGSTRGSSQKNAKEFDRIEVSKTDPSWRRKLETFLNDLTTYYWTDKILSNI